MTQEQNKSRSLLKNPLPYVAALGTAGAVAAVTYFKYAHAQRHPSSNCSELEHLVASASTLLTPENIAIATTALSFGLGFIKITPGISAALSPATFKLAATEALRPSALATGYNLASTVGMSLSQAFQYGTLAALANYVAYNAGYVARCFFEGFGSSDAPKKIVSREEGTVKHHFSEKTKYGFRNHLCDIAQVIGSSCSDLFYKIVDIKDLRPSRFSFLAGPGAAYLIYESGIKTKNNTLPLGTALGITLATTLGTLFAGFTYYFIKEYKEMIPSLRSSRLQLENLKLKQKKLILEKEAELFKKEAELFKENALYSRTIQKLKSEIESS
mgnify:CR=1 FL=1